MGKSLEEIESAFQQKHDKVATIRTNHSSAILETKLEKKLEPQLEKRLELQLGKKPEPQLGKRLETQLEKRLEPQLGKKLETNKIKRRGGNTYPPHVLLASEGIFYFALIAMVLCTGLFFSGNIRGRETGNPKFLEMLTPSMQSVYPKGSLLLMEEVSIEELQKGDDISYEKAGEVITITHRITEIQENYEGLGKRAFVTKGVENPVNDQDIVLAENVLGRVRSSVPVLGGVLGWVARNMFFILIAFLILMTCSFGMKIFWHVKKRAE